jgi:phytase-like protein
VKVGDLAAIGATRQLESERGSGASTTHRKIYVIDLAGATDLHHQTTGKKPLEPMSDRELARTGTTPVGEELLVDLATLGFGHELVEGLAIVNETTIAVVNDHSFAADEATELMLVRLPTPLR